MLLTRDLDNVDILPMGLEGPLRITGHVPVHLTTYPNPMTGTRDVNVSLFFRTNDSIFFLPTKNLSFCFVFIFQHNFQEKNESFDYLYYRTGFFKKHLLSFLKFFTKRKIEINVFFCFFLFNWGKTNYLLINKSKFLANFFYFVSIFFVICWVQNSLFLFCFDLY